MPFFLSHPLDLQFFVFIFKCFPIHAFNSFITLLVDKMNKWTKTQDFLLFKLFFSPDVQVLQSKSILWSLFSGARQLMDCYPKSSDKNTLKRWFFIDKRVGWSGHLIEISLISAQYSLKFLHCYWTVKWSETWIPWTWSQIIPLFSPILHP